MIEFSLSTTGMAGTAASGADLVRQITAGGFTTIELSFSLPQQMVAEIATCVRQQRVAVSSVHNVCPVPAGFPAFSFSPDYFSLASLDQDSKQQAVSMAAASVRTAVELGATALVLHGGRVEIPERLKELRRFYDHGVIDSAPAERLRAMMRAERQVHAAAHVQALIDSLEQLLAVASDAGIYLCLENRFYYRELPAGEEFGRIFSHFRGNPWIRYWHDIGHAVVAERLKLADRATLLPVYAENLAGIHIHDVRGCHDHLPPGQGDVDFSYIAPYLTDTRVVKVLEIHAPATVADVRQSARLLASGAAPT